MTPFFRILVCLLLFCSSFTRANAVDVVLDIFEVSPGSIQTRSFVFSPGVNAALTPGDPVDANVLFDIAFFGAGPQATTSIGAFSLDLLNIVGVDDVSATLSGGTLPGPVNLGLTTTTAGTALSFTGSLGAGSYTLAFGGNIPASRAGGGSITGSVSVSAVPIPAAIWLFGSTLVALFGIRRKIAVADNV